MLTLLTIDALSFPENTRLGYPSCYTCHYSPTGGGLLNPYGKSTAPEISSFNFEKKQNKSDQGLSFGSDIRLIYLKTTYFEAAFPMQADFELGLNYSKMSGVVQAGFYGKDAELKSYKGYLVYLHKNQIFRLGKFSPAFGLNYPDHKLPGRNYLGFDQRSSSFNLEYTFLSKNYSFNTTFIGGFQKQPLYNHPKKIDIFEYGDLGLGFQANFTPKASIYQSFSAIILQDFETSLIKKYYSLSGILGSKKIYFIYELSKEKFKKKQQTGYFKLGFMPINGLHTLYFFKKFSNSYSYGKEFIWYIVNGIEINFSLATNVSEYQNSNDIILITHMYF